MKNKHTFIGIGLLIVFSAAVLLFSEPLPQKLSTFSKTLSAPEKVYGVMSDDTSMNSKLNTINLVGLSATRETVLTSTWKGKSVRCEFWNWNNIQMYLNINSHPQGQGYEFPNDSIEIADYLTKMLTIATLYNPYMVFVENEDLNNSYHEGDLFNDYTKLIQVAIDSGHAHGLKISNGGLTSRQLVRLCYRNLLVTDETKAAWFLANCVPIDDTSWVANFMTDTKKEAELAMNERLLNQYSILNLDAVNIHLYLPFRNRTKGQTVKGATTAGLVEVIAYLNSMLDGKKIISNEIGFVENNQDLSFNTYRILDSANIEACFYGGNGSKRFIREGQLTRLGTGINNYTP